MDPWTHAIALSTARFMQPVSSPEDGFALAEVLASIVTSG